MSNFIGWSYDREKTYAEGWRVTLTPEEEENLTKILQQWSEVVKQKKIDAIEKPFKDEDDLFEI